MMFRERSRDMKTLITNGLVIDPANGVHARLDLLLADGKVAAVGEVPAESGDVRRIDASGKIVCPGFIDLDMHEDPVGSDGRIIYNEERSIFACELRMGVTTVIAGNCGDNVCDPGDYLDLADRDGTPVNVGMLAGHTWFRNRAGATDKYAPATNAQIEEMRRGIENALQRGCVGVSYGLRYVPGLNARELLQTASPVQGTDKFVAAHIRDDAAGVFVAARELLDLGKELGVSIELSHIGSMAGYGQMAEFLELVDLYRMQGLDVKCDCYPYDAFSTALGSTTYDEGWLDRYHCGYDVLEICEGKYKGQRCTREIFDETRRDFPDYRTVCHVMLQSDVNLAFDHGGVMLVTDGTLNDGQGHPRAAGTFPRFLARYVREGSIPMDSAIAMMTTLPAQRLHLNNKGRLNVGSDADVVIFDPERVRDCATFEQPVLPPEGIDYVFVGGELAAENGKIVSPRCGHAVRR